MEECDHTSKQLRANAELLEAVCKDKLQQLHQDKQRARKAYQEEHQKITTQFNNVCAQRACPSMLSWFYVIAHFCFC